MPVFIEHVSCILSFREHSEITCQALKPGHLQANHATHASPGPLPSWPGALGALWDAAKCWGSLFFARRAFGIVCTSYDMSYDLPAAKLALGSFHCC